MTTVFYYSPHGNAVCVSVDVSPLNSVKNEDLADTIYCADQLRIYKYE